MPKILNPKLLPGNSPQFVLALQSPLYQAAHPSSSRPLIRENGSKPTTRSRGKSVGVLEVGKCGISRAPTGPVRGMRGAFVHRANANGPIRNGVESDWVNVLISVDAPASAQTHNVPIEVKEVTNVPLSELWREVKLETEEEAPQPVKKRARKREVEEPESPGQANKRPRIAPQTSSQESSGFLKRSTESGSFQPSYDELRTFQCNAKRLLDEVEQGIDLFRIKELQRIDAEKAKAGIDAAEERSKLVSKLESLKQENSFVRAKCAELEMEVDRLSQEKAEAEKKLLEAEADKENLLVEETKELAKKHEEEVDALGREFVALQGKGICQMCYINPRDGLVLPCLHLLYCYQCLEKHKTESKECPWVSCRGRISALLQCNLTGEKSPA